LTCHSRQRLRLLPEEESALLILPMAETNLVDFEFDIIKLVMKGTGVLYGAVACTECVELDMASKGSIAAYLLMLYLKDIALPS